MKYKELMDTCSEIWRKYGEQGNSFLGLCEARQYCVRHISECEDITQKQLTTIQGWQEYKDFQNEIQRYEQAIKDMKETFEEMSKNTNYVIDAVKVLGSLLDNPDIKKKLGR